MPDECLEVTSLSAPDKTDRTVCVNEKHRPTLETVEFFIDKAHQEAKFYWLRTNVFLLLHGAAFTLILPRAYGENAMPATVLTVMSVFGAFLAVIWMFVNRDSFYIYQRWYEDARHIIRNCECIQGLFRHSLFGKEQKYHLDGWKVRDPFVKHPSLIRATYWMYVLAGLFLLAWLALLLTAILRDSP